MPLQLSHPLRWSPLSFYALRLRRRQAPGNRSPKGSEYHGFSLAYRCGCILLGTDREPAHPIDPPTQFYRFFCFDTLKPIANKCMNGERRCGRPEANVSKHLRAMPCRPGSRSSTPFPTPRSCLSHYPPSPTASFPCSPFNRPPAHLAMSIVCSPSSSSNTTQLSRHVPAPQAPSAPPSNRASHLRATLHACMQRARARSMDCLVGVELGRMQEKDKGENGHFLAAVRRSALSVE